MKKVIKLLKKVVLAYEIKHPEYEEPAFICSNPDVRNRSKNDKYKIPEDQPQCPVYKDNRCCGGCRFASTCEHCVNCSCYGFVFGQMGGTDKQYYLHKASKYYGLGRIDKNGKFDWDYYKKNLRRKEIVPGKFICVDNEFYEIRSEVDYAGDFTAINCETKEDKKIHVDDLGDYVHVYENLYATKMFN